MTPLLEGLFFSPLAARFNLQFGEDVKQLLCDQFGGLDRGRIASALAKLIVKPEAPDYFCCLDALEREARKPADDRPTASYSQRGQAFGATVIWRGTRQWDDWLAYYELKKLKFPLAAMRHGQSWTVPDCDVDEFEPGWRDLKRPVDDASPFAMAS